METDEAREFINLLRQVDGKNAIVILRTVRMLLACCQNDAEIGAALVVRSPADEENWILHVNALNLDLDDTYIILTRAAVQIAEYIKAEAPPSEYLN